MTCINLQLVQNNNLVSDVLIQRSLSAFKEMFSENGVFGLPESAGLPCLRQCAGDLDLVHLINPFSFLFFNDLSSSNGLSSLHHHKERL
jgi:hypothetical protein